MKPDPLHELSRADLHKFAIQMEATVKALQLAIEHEQNLKVSVLAKNIELVKKHTTLAKEVNTLTHQYKVLESFTHEVLNTHPAGAKYTAHWNTVIAPMPPDPDTMPGFPDHFDIDDIDGKKK